MSFSIYSGDDLPVVWLYIAIAASGPSWTNASEFGDSFPKLYLRFSRLPPVPSDALVHIRRKHQLYVGVTRKNKSLLTIRGVETSRASVGNLKLCRVHNHGYDSPCGILLRSER